MDRYQRVEKPRTDTAPINENEIRITTQGRMRNYITYAITLLHEKGSDEIVVKAMGRAIYKTVMISELIKRRVVGLHQNTWIGSTNITDMWEPLEEGLLPLETTRHVSVIVITLSKKQLNTASTGYQPPLPVDQVKPFIENEEEVEGVQMVRGLERGSGGGHSRGRGRGRGRARGRGRGGEYYEDGYGDSWDGGRGYGGGRGRGRAAGRPYRGQGQRGYANQSVGYYTDYSESYAAAPVSRGRARARGSVRGVVRNSR